VKPILPRLAEIEIQEDQIERSGVEQHNGRWGGNRNVDGAKPARKEGTEALGDHVVVICNQGAWSQSPLAIS